MDLVVVTVFYNRFPGSGGTLQPEITKLLLCDRVQNLRNMRSDHLRTISVRTSVVGVVYSVTNLVSG